MRVEITKRADKDLLNLDDARRKRVLTALRSLQEQPTPSDIKKIKGQPNRWRLRIPEIFEFAKIGLVPYDEHGKPLLPEKFLAAQQKVGALPLEHDNYWKPELDALAIRHDALLELQHDNYRKRELDALTIQYNVLLELVEDEKRRKLQLREWQDFWLNTRSTLGKAFR